MDKKHIDELSHERVENAKNRIAKCLNLLEATHGELEWMFEQNPDWNSDIKWEIELIACKLGFALATFHNWWEEPEDE